MIKNKIYSNVIMQDLETLEKIENQLNSLTLDNDETKPLEATKTIKKKKVLSERQLEVLSNARAKLAERNKERIVQKKLEQQAIEDEVQRRLNEYKSGVDDKIVKKATTSVPKSLPSENIFF